MRLAQVKLRGMWQADSVQFLLGGSHRIYQGPRQACGKSFILSFILAAYILAGMRVCVAMPTLKQGGRVIIRETLRRLALYEDMLGPAMRRTVRNTLEVVWANGGAIMALSTDDAARRGAQGFTVHVLAIDEAHETTPEIMDVFEPLVTVALKEGVGQVFLTGVGGLRRSLIESSKLLDDYSSLRIDDARVCKDDPSWQATFDGYKRRFTARQYKQMYQCLPVVEAAGNLIFEALPSVAQPLYIGGQPDACLGVDVGRWRDWTVAALHVREGGVLRWRNNLILEDMPLTEQAVKIAQFARAHYVRPERVAVEVNGLGHGVHDLLVHGVPDKLAPLLPGAQGVHLSYNLKLDTIERMQSDARANLLAVEDATTHADLSELTFEVTHSAKGAVLYKFDHDDLLSAGIMAYCARGNMGVAA